MAIIINLASLAAVWFMAGMLKREREQRKNELQTQRNVYAKGFKTCKQEYKRLHASYEKREGQIYAKLINDIQEELRGLNGRVCTPEEARRKSVLNGSLEYLREL